MKKQFVTYEIAVKLKELGFNEACLGYYPPLKKELTIWYNDEISNEYAFVLAPLWQQTIDWCAEKYNINIYVAYCEYGIKTENSWKYSFTNPTNPQYWVGKYKTKKEAIEQAILKAIELIELIKEK